MMDEYLDHLISSSSWTDENPKERSSWFCSETGEINGLLLDSVEMINSSHNINNSSTRNTSSIVLGGDLGFILQNGLLSTDAQPPQDGQNCESNTSSKVVVKDGSKSGYLDLHFNTAIQTTDSRHLSSSKQLPGVGSMMRSPLSFSETGYVGSNGTESQPSEFQSSLDFHTPPPTTQLWPPQSYGGISTLSSVLLQDKMQGFGLLGEYIDNELEVMENSYGGNDNSLHLSELSASISFKENPELRNLPLSSFVAGPQITMTAGGLKPVLQKSSVTACGGCNGSGKLRVRARRGQATDPHSIAERLRREKIAERMKNLQELLPNSNKTDKASMLEEIIEYVKYLQLQVKVLSMSRLGAAGAVVPLITDGQVEGSGVLLLPSAGQEAKISESPDQLAFEEELLKLMESNITMAIQYLQSKGVCLMPIALAAAISARKASSSLSSGHFSEETKKLMIVDSHSSNGYSGVGVGTHLVSPGSKTVV